MNHETGDRSIKGGEDSLFRHLAPDTPAVKKIKSLQGIEYEYAEHIGITEYSIARHFCEADRKIKDKDAVSALKNIRKNDNKDVSFFKQDLEKEIVKNLIELLEEKPITHHELKLVIDYILEVIENRSWMEDEQAYIKWVAYVMNLFTEEENEEYEKSIKQLAAKLGLSGKHAELILMKGDEEDYFEFVEEYGEENEVEERDEREELTEKEMMAEVESRFLSMEDPEKFDFLLENGPEFYELAGLYISELSEKGEFGRIQEIYSKLTEKYDDFIYLYVFMGATYLEMDPALAKSYFEQALRALDKLNDLSDSTKERLRTNFLALIEKIN
ncbi:hypothetical protein EO98_15985 [Methanosarcina sp. 2.H.T.1A.6]|uniref:hypothetical protein n=1 Tax=unclassified Methanosarcina TaxID=2644672 RepID=UPI0006224B4C|nr:MULTISPECIES: hypothetical protein [unclassified Methanosarcina]KKG11763.1 hypothetical protein EO97_11485 [Methanosarcina sp. 2.H.T.1A.15]KKG17657.1 hypothetical protein EO94_12410 [Methanosarcina sp. 2.H.T.1A.3]KKG21897.1 hypothetical protein EO98_15985 [Methanosarcina sp. 2.H.T.1A.6]KKG25433.1 hypothetical protein EO96_00435 [Methanosarcina sp. 2.H.T.1A.8]